MNATPRDSLSRPLERGQRIRLDPDGDCARARARLLLIESDESIADLVATFLEEEGYAVDRVADPGAACAYLIGRGPAACDLVLSAPYSDPLHAPYAWLDRLHACVQAPIVICARYPAVFYADHHRRGYAAYLEEPFDLRDLIDVVADLCSRREKDPS